MREIANSFQSPAVAAPIFQSRRLMYMSGLAAKAILQKSRTSCRYPCASSGGSSAYACVEKFTWRTAGQFNMWWATRLMVVPFVVSVAVRPAAFISLRKSANPGCSVGSPRTCRYTFSMPASTVPAIHFSKSALGMNERDAPELASCPQSLLGQKLQCKLQAFVISI